MREAFPETVVDESRVHVHFAGLRKVPEDDRDRVDGVTARDYPCFGPARGHPDAPTWQDVAPDVSSSRSHLIVQGRPPEAGLPLVGRARELDAARQALLSRRCVTLTGGEGVGKTRLALEIARTPAFADGVCWVSLSAARKPQAALDAFALTVCGELSAGRGVFEQLRAVLVDKEMLVILDCVDGVPDTAAHLVEALLDASDRIRVLATGHHALKARRETVQHLAPLDVPPCGASHAQTLDSAAVRLFVAATRVAGARFSVEEHNLGAVAELCRDLRGIPLSIELAAAQAALNGELALVEAACKHGLAVGANPQTSLPKRSWLTGVLDLSVRTLDDPARIALRWLAIFVDGFSLDGACQVLAAAGLDRSRTVDALADLLSSALTIRESHAPNARYRLHEAVRRHALEMLCDSGEHPAAARAHAAYLCSRFDRAHRQWSDRPIAEWLIDFQVELGALRAACAWALPESGDAALAVQLVVVIVPYLFDLSLVDECRTLTRDALDILERGADAFNDASQAKVRLLAAHSASLVYTHGPGPVALAAWRNVLALAVETGNREFELRAIWGLWIVHRYSGEVTESLTCARRFSEMANESPTATLKVIAAHMEGIALHYAGCQAEALEHLEPMLDANVSEHLRWNIVGLQIEWRIGALATLARIHWLQGDAAKALETAENALQAALRHQNAMVLCYVLAETLIPVALLSRQFAAAQCALTTLTKIASRFGLSFWLVCATAYSESLRLAQDGDACAISRVQTALDQLRECCCTTALSTLAGLLASSLADAGRYAEALAVVDETLQRSRETGEHWYTAELLRIKGELLSIANRKADAACFFAIAQDQATRQSAHLLSLRATLSLATLWHGQGHTDAAIRSLALLCDGAWQRTDHASRVLDPGPGIARCDARSLAESNITRHF